MFQQISALNRSLYESQVKMHKAIKRRNDTDSGAILVLVLCCKNTKKKHHIIRQHIIRFINVGLDLCYETVFIRLIDVRWLIVLGNVTIPNAPSQ